MNNSASFSPIYKVLRIYRGTTVDGPGFRTAIYLSGCSHHCQGCHNPQSWDPMQGEDYTLQQIMEIVEEEDFDVTITGGDPLFNPSGLKILIHAIKKNRRNVWVYTGYTWEEIISSPQLLDAIIEADIIVDGKFVESLKDIDIPFRGSTNQRIIDVQQSLDSGKIVILRR